MIINEVFKRPIISFGLGMTMLSCEVGDDVTIWQNEIYNGNEYVLEQDEVYNSVMFSRYFYSEVNPFDYTEQDIYMTFNGFVNEKPSYICEFNSKTFYIYYNLSNTLTSANIPDGYYFVGRWVVVGETLGVQNNNVMSCLINNSFYPITQKFNWDKVGYDSDFECLVPIDVTVNVNNQKFTMTATETKYIQIEMVNKRTNHKIKSNKILLIVNESSS